MATTGLAANETRHLLRSLAVRPHGDWPDRACAPVNMLAWMLNWPVSNTRMEIHVQTPGCKMQCCCRQTDRKRVEKRISSLSTSCLMEAFNFARTFKPSAGPLFLRCIMRRRTFIFIIREGKNLVYCANCFHYCTHTRFSTEKSLLYARVHLRFHVHATANELTKLNSLLNLLNRYQCKCDIAIRHCLSRSLSLSLCQREYKVITALI